MLTLICTQKLNFVSGQLEIYFPTIHDISDHNNKATSRCVYGPNPNLFLAPACRHSSLRRTGVILLRVPVSHWQGSLRHTGPILLQVHVSHPQVYYIVLLMLLDIHLLPRDGVHQLITLGLISGLPFLDTLCDPLKCEYPIANSKPMTSEITSAWYANGQRQK